MSTGKRIAKRSIIGTRVCAPVQDGKYYSGVIQAVKTPAHIEPQSNCLNLTPDTRYTVRFDSRQGNVGGTTVEYFEADLIGPGFHSVVGTELVRNQKCFVTFNGREVCGEVMTHHVETDEVIIRIHPSGTEAPFEVQKKLEEVRLLESRKSARLADQDTDFARLADMAGDRKRTASHTIEVPASSHHGSRKRRTSSSQDDNMHPKDMDECSAALVLMSLSCSPQNAFSYGTSPGSSNSSSASFRSTPSPPPFNSPMNSFSSVSDEGIVMDYIGEDQPRKKKIWGSYSFNIEGYDSALAKEKENTRVFQCIYRGCKKIFKIRSEAKEHVRTEHKALHSEEDFYYDELVQPPNAPPTLSHRDMARPPHEDPDYQRQLVGSIRQSLFTASTNIPQSPHKLPKLSPRPHSPKVPHSPRRIRGENKKCRKVYGMEHKDQWCTQCKWKKACSRFGD
ncbi:glucose transporter 4 enhancer factor isoform X2 [Rhynchophorus ferrugineus]|uniref:glucose transporter 4 enhancer factor isoform X2 n=1 Tax=Rhynchophorus ferrugineus TaxID=354439 RepID=UPI003FCE0DAD